MLKDFRFKLARFISPERERELSNDAERLNKIADDLQAQLDEAENAVGQRVAAIMANADPLEPLLRDFKGVFSNDKERPEDKLDAVSSQRLEMFGWRNHQDEAFHYLLDWCTNTLVSANIKARMVSEKDIVLAHMYSRALIAVSKLVKEEVGRLSSLYEQRLPRPGTGFDPNKAVE